MGLKRIAIILGGLFLVAVLAVSWLLTRYTDLIETKASAIITAVESLRSAEELEIRLLTHSRETLLAGLTPDPSHAINRTQSEQLIADWLKVSRRFVGSQEEETILNDAERAVEAYLRERHELDRKNLQPFDAYLQSQPSLKDALAKVRTLTELNLAEAQALGEQAKIENTSAKRQAAFIAFLCVLTVPVFWLMLVRWGYDPIKRLSAGITEFKATKKPVKLDIEGITEIREIAESFSELTDELADQRRTQVRFLAGVAHDLKNPLGAIRMSADLLTSEAMPPEEQKDIVEIISRQAVLLERMVGDFLETSRIESGDLDIRKQTCDLDALIGDAVNLHRPLSSVHHLEFTSDQAPAICVCDPVRVSQVINNLLSNAIKYSPNGGRVNIHLSSDPNGLTSIRVSDEGMGIAKEDQARIFEPFRRTKLTKETIPGVGLGLSVVKRIAEAHGGRIDVQSEPNRGTTFTVWLPTNNAPDEARVDASFTRAASPDGERSIGRFH